MNSQPPPWPDQPAQPARRGRLTALFSSRSQLVLVAIAGACAVLVVALLGTLLVVLSSNARGATSGSQAQTGQTGQTATTGTVQPTETDAANGTSTPGSSGAGGGGGTHRTSTPTPSPGPQAPPSVHQVVNQVTLSGFGDGPVVVATCPSGELALSGGWAAPYGSGATIYRSTRSGTRGWAVYVNHPMSVLVTSYAECLKDAPGATIAERSAPSVSLAPNYAGDAYPKCHAGEVVAGGGFAFDVHTNVGLDVFRDFSSDSQWEGQVLNFGTTPTLASVYAECLAYSGASMQTTALTGTTIAAGSQGSAISLGCPSGYLMSGGGFEDSGQAFIYDMQTRLVFGDSGGTYMAWVVSLNANGGINEGLSVLAICLHL